MKSSKVAVMDVVTSEAWPRRKSPGSRQSRCSRPATMAGIVSNCPNDVARAFSDRRYNAGHEHPTLVRRLDCKPEWHSLSGLVSRGREPLDPGPHFERPEG